MRMIQLDQETPSVASDWDSIVAAAHQHDFYHLSSYHQLAQERGEGRAFLFLLEDAGRFVALPLLLRSVSEVPGLESESFLDATSVYGYAGPISSHTDLPESLLTAFREELKIILQRMNVVSVFSRLHPLIPQESVLDGLGYIKEHGKTVVVDLTNPIDQQRREYRRDHKRDTNRLRRMGWRAVSCHGGECVEGPALREFIAIYHETMDRLEADHYYYFDEEYFRSFLMMPGAENRLFWVELDRQVGAIGLFTMCDGIVQYHLSGTSSRFLKDAPMKLLLDEVRLWANARGARFFHLGGGVQGQEDSLFRFKAGFSKRYERFRVWNWIVKSDAYEHLLHVRQRETRQGFDSRFFPAYRA